MRTTHASRVAWFAGGILLAILASDLSAQTRPAQPTRPGWVLVDDIWLPEEVVYGEALFNATPWPSGNVPFTIDNSIPTTQRGPITIAMEDLEAVCGVDFYPRTAESNYVRFTPYANANAAVSEVGMIGGEQLLQVGANISSKLTFVHELIHTLGFEHEQSRPDRDTYVSVNWGNISTIGCPPAANCNGNFAIINTGTVHGPYDFFSIMHYSQFGFSVCTDPSGPACTSNLTTIDCRPGFTQFQTVIGTRGSMSFGDASALILHYGGTSVSPTISGVCPGIVPENALDPTVTIYGGHFYQGSLDGTGVLGTQVLVNGIPVPSTGVTYFSSTRIDAVIPTLWFVNQGTLQISVDNVYAGTSPAHPLVVGPAVSYIGNWHGTDVGSHMGEAVTGIGDIDADGYDDVVVGSPGDFNGNDPHGGRVTCYSGNGGGELWTYLGDAPRGYGTALAAGGDLNGDGIQEVLVGAPGTFGANPTTGRVRILSGLTGAVFRTYSGTVVNDGFGTSVANAGDVNGDGFQDQIVGVPLGNQARIYSGANGILIRTHSGPAGSNFGWSVAGGIDFNLDGAPDVAIGAPWYSGFRGRFYVFSAASASQLMSVIGPAANDRYGHSLAMMPSPDGRPGGALFIGCPGTFSDRGQVRAYGANAVTPYPLVALRSGDAANDHFGWSVAPAGDIDQDGRMDYAIGAPQESPQPGYVRLYSATGEVFRDVTGTEPFGQFGWSVGYAGDFDRDGVPDVIIGAANTGGSCINSGSAHILKDVRPPERNRVMITEVFWGEPQGLEITNFAESPVSIAGMKVIWDDGVRRMSGAIGPVTMAPGESILARECLMLPTGACSTGVGLYPETPPATRQIAILPDLVTQQQALSVGLLTAGGVVIDEVRFAAVGMTSNALKGVGGHFRGAGARLNGSVSAERIWGLDSNSGGDWTSETVRSFGLENRSSGQRGSDPIQIEEIVINEMLDQETVYSENYLELKNPGFYAVDLQNWVLRWSPGQNQPHAEILPWPSTEHRLDPGAFTVIGDVQAPPAELPPTVTYTQVAVDNPPYYAFPANTEEFEIALYDDHGRLVDLARGTGHDDLRVHNHPRAPSAWDDFGGAVRRSFDTGSGAVGRDAASTDTDSGADFRPIYVRTMGSENAPSTWGGFPGHGHRFDVRLNEGGLGDGLTVILNAGSSQAGKRWSFFVNVGHLHGQGPFFGLGADALAFWLALSNVPPWFGFLDGRGSARLDLPPGSLPPGIQTDDIFILQDAGGGVDLRTTVIEWDT